MRLAVRLQAGTRLDLATRVATVQGATVRRRLPELRTFSIEVPRQLAPRVRAALAARAGVRDVTPVQRRRLAFVPNDPEYARQAGYLAQVGAQRAWNTARGSAGVRIAVIDSGLDVRHPDLRGKVVGRYNAVTGNADVTDRVGHGTFVAGVAAAATHNRVGVVGTGFRSSLLAVKVIEDDGEIWTDDEAAGIVWAADHGARVINISLGSAFPDAAEGDAIAYARRRGAVVVASAGNEGTSRPSYPAALPGVIAVGATNGPARAGFSNFGSWVDVGAPGVDLRSTAPTAGSEVGRGYAYGSGTSYSSPLVAGQVALLAAAHPGATPTALAQAVAAGTFGSYGFARGRVSIPAALAALGPAPVRVVSFAPDPFSPNADRRRDTARLLFRTARTQPVTLTIRNARGVGVLGPRSLGVLRPGVHAVVWTGRDAAGRPYPDGSYVATLVTRGGRGIGSVVLDRGVPRVSALRGAGATFHPRPDGYRDRFTPTLVTPERLSSLSLNIYNTAGLKLRTLPGGTTPAGRVGVAWDGRRANGTYYPAGSYRFRFVAYDRAGNQRITGAYPVTLSLR